MPSLLRFLCCCVFGTLASAAELERALPPAGIGSVVEWVSIHGVTFHNVRVRAISRAGVTLQYEGGLSSVKWSDLPSEWRSALASQIPADPKPTKSSRSPTPTGASVIIPEVPAEPDFALKSFLANIGQPPEVRASVDMRPRLRDLGLWIKNQGRRPSCSVYSILSALELQYSELAKRAVHFDEEALIQSTEQVTHRRREADSLAPDTVVDAGYTLLEVVQAIRTYGLVLAKESTPTPNPGEPLKLPPQPKVDLHLFPKEEPRVAMGNLINALNAGLPVPIGLDWPSPRAAQGGYLDTQMPADRAKHAVTLVGYQSNSGRLEDVVFIFRNSYGVAWGASGYGRVTYAYLSKHLQCAVVLQLPPQGTEG